RADLVKIDCEGSEYPIIYETPAACWDKVSVLAIEVHDLDEHQRNAGYLTGFLESQGYEVVSTRTHGNCHALEPSEKRDNHFHDQLPMNQILIDCERTKHPHTGLFHFCLHLGNALIRHADPAREQLTFYVPQGQRSLFGPEQDYFFHRRFHRWWIPRTRSFSLWHGTYQN